MQLPMQPVPTYLPMYFYILLHTQPYALHNMYVCRSMKYFSISLYYRSSSSTTPHEHISGNDYCYDISNQVSYHEMSLSWFGYVGTTSTTNYGRYYVEVHMYYHYHSIVPDTISYISECPDPYVCIDRYSYSLF